MIAIHWFRKDLRLLDNAALTSAAKESKELHLVATADQLGENFSNLSEVRKSSLMSSWLSLGKEVAGKLQVLQNPNELIEFAKQINASRVYVTNVFDTYGVKELNAVESDLARNNIQLYRIGSNYTVEPGLIRKKDGSAYKVYTPFSNEWLRVAAAKTLDKPNLANLKLNNDFVSKFSTDDTEYKTVIAGEAQAAKTLAAFRKTRLAGYAENRNRPDLGGTSHLSHALSHGEIHPSRILQLLGDDEDSNVFRKELIWREFYADVLFHNPASLEDYFDAKYAHMQYDFDETKFVAWKFGKTGYPIVDAGMRQLLQTGWMHNRVRMIVASFLVKDLHVEWMHGAKWFQENLTDYDPASNSHGWQWTAGCGTDASPYYRIFNPITQGQKFDPDGKYVRKFIPELAHLTGSAVHEPWLDMHGYSNGYPKQIVDHAEERIESLRRLEELKKS